MAAKAPKSDDIDNRDPDIVREAEEFAALNQASGGDLFKAIEELRSSGGAGVVCIVTRLTPVDQKGYCGVVGVSDFSLERIRTVYGAGRYMVQIKGPKGFLPGGGPIEIAPTLETVKPAGGSDFMTFLEFQQKQQAERESKRSELLALAIPALGTALAGWLARPSGTQGPDIASLITALKPAPGPTLSDLSTVMVNMQTLAAPKGGESTVDTVLRVFEAARDLSGDKESDGGKGGGSSWVDVIRDLIKVAPEGAKAILQARMEAMQKAAQPTAQQIHPPIAPVVVPVAAASAPASTPIKDSVSSAANIPLVDSAESNAMLQLLMPVIREHLAKVATWAEKERDTEVYADVFLDELPDNAGQYFSTQQVLDYLNDGRWWEVVSEIEPRLKNHFEWCNELRLELISIFEEEIKKQAGSIPAPAPGQGYPAGSGTGVLTVPHRATDISDGAES